MSGRLVDINKAAEHCGLSVSGYRACMKSIGLPGPVPGTKRYDLKHIDKVLDRLSGLQDDALSEFDQWEAEYGEEPLEAR